MISDRSISGMRLMLRFANEFVLDVFGRARGGLDFTDALILTVLVQSKSAALAGDVALQHAYASFEAPPPSSLRRPISVNGMAASLGLPFETVRRRVRRLAERGICEILPDGVRLSDAHLRSVAHRRALERSYGLTRELYERLKRADCLPPTARQAPAHLALAAEPPPLRLVARTVAAYLLRTMERVLPNFESPAHGFVVMAIVRTNTRGIPDEMRGLDAMTPDAHIPDQLRRPARVSEVADLLGLPYETVRRHIAVLVADGRCRKAPGGIVVPIETLMRDNVLNAFGGNLANLNRMMGALAETGVLAMWEAESETAAAAAAGAGRLAAE